MNHCEECPDCGAAIPDGQPKGLCPRCALKGALELSNGENQVLQTEGSANAVSPQPVTPVGQLPTLKHFGDYELLEEIARGGMGIVYKARQVSLDRIVAVKLLLRGEFASEDFIKRFRIEASAAASLQHPNIVAIHEVGVHEGHHYFAMDLVDGPNLARLLRDGPLPAKRAAGYVKTIAEAIHYAHEKGILHRDLKPSNVLIDMNDQPRVTDFGLAKRLGTESQPTTDLTQLTLSGHVLGSPGYMPPEQAIGAHGKMSRRSDVYSLGAMLYHLLTGQPPFGGGSVGETLKRVETQEPVSLRLLNPGVPIDLETVCLKCLEKDPERRYRSARVLSEELARFISDEPIQARPPSKLYRFRKLAQRNKLVFAAAAALVAALLAGTIVSTWQAIRATRAETLAKKRLLQVAVERDEKDKARQEAEAVSTFLTEVFQSPDPARDGRTVTVAETLDRAVHRIDTNLAGQPSRRAKLQFTLGSTYNILGLDREAIPLLEKARDYYRVTFGPEHLNTLRAMHNLAISHHGGGRLGEALKAGEELWRSTEHPDTLLAMHNLATYYYDAARRDEALKMREDVLALRRKVLGPEHRDTYTAMYTLAVSYGDDGRTAEALQLREQVLAFRRKTLGPEDPNTLAAMTGLAHSFDAAGRREEALQLGEEIVALRRKIQGSDHPDTLMALNNLANSHHYVGHHDLALRLREEVLALRRKGLGPEHPDTLGAMNNLALSYRNVGRQGEALTLREQVLTLRRKVLGPEHPDTLTTMQDLANGYQYASRWGEALPLREEVLRLRRQVLPPGHRGIIGAMNNLAISYDQAGRHDEALQLQAEIFTTTRKALGPDHPDTQGALNTLARAYRSKRRFANAESLYRENLQNQAWRHRATNEIVVAASSALAGLLHDWAWSERDAADKTAAVGRARESAQLLRDCLGARVQTLRPDSARLADTRSRLGGVFVALAVLDSALTPEARLDQFTEAESLLLKAHETFQQNETADPAYRREALKLLIRLYETWGKPEKLSYWQQRLDSLNAGKPNSSPVTEE